MTDRGRPVALLAPLPEVGPLERLRATGEVSKADGKLTEPPPLLQLAPGQEPPSKILALPLGEPAVRRGREVLARLELIRVGDGLLAAAAGGLLPAEPRTLDAIHLSTAQQLGGDLARLLTSDERMRAAASAIGFPVVAPA